MSESFQILGMKEAYQMIESLTAKDQQKIILGTLKTAANRNIKSKLEQKNSYKPSKSRRGKGFITINDRRDPLGIYSGVDGSYYHYRFLEFGTKPRFTKSFKNSKTRDLLGRKKTVKIKKKSAYRGIMPRRPFIVETIENNLEPLTNFFGTDFGSQVKKRLDRLARKNK